MSSLKLYMILLGCKPEGRHTEQHDMFFTISDSLKNTLPEVQAFWPEAKDKIHIDAFREVNLVDGFAVQVAEKAVALQSRIEPGSYKLFFINLGGYKQNEFDEFHYKMLIVAKDKGDAVQQAKQSAFYKHTGFEGANSHIDDKYGVDVDDLYEIADILPAAVKKRYTIMVTPAANKEADQVNLGYFKLSNIK